MSYVSRWLESGEKNLPVWSADIRERLEADPKSVPLVIRLSGADGIAKDFLCRLPFCDNGAEADFACDWFSAQLYNILSVYSAKNVTVLYKAGEKTQHGSAACESNPDGNAAGGSGPCANAAAGSGPCGSAAAANAVGESMTEHILQKGLRRFMTVPGFRKLSNIARRITDCELTFTIQETDCLPEPETASDVQRVESRNAFAERLSAALKLSETLSGCGIDIGGTDIKLAASYKGRLIAVKEYDWNPASFTTAEQLLNPILLLTSLMAACLTAATGGDSLCGETIRTALLKEASDDAMMQAVREISERYGRLEKFDGIGLSFPDIVIHDRILGGETSKTMGMRNNPDMDYEDQLKKIAGLNELLLDYGKEVHGINDGHMAAFTTAAERFAESELCGSGRNDGSLQGAVCAHTLGTDLGSGWFSPSGDAPDYPYECCNLIFDMGSFFAKSLPFKDVRSALNDNSELPVAAKYLGQAAASRLIWETEPELIAPFTVWDGGSPCVRTYPEDMRKPCLEKIMNAAAEGDPAACDVFRRIGVHLAYLTKELEFVAPTGTGERTLYGRFIKNGKCFELVKEGFGSVCPSIRLQAADESLACSALMKQLTGFPGMTVAQFGQAVGSVVYAFYK